MIYSSTLNSKGENQSKKNDVIFFFWRVFQEVNFVKQPNGFNSLRKRVQDGEQGPDQKKRKRKQNKKYDQLPNCCRS